MLQNGLPERRLQRGKPKPPVPVVPYNKLNAAAAKIANTIKQNNGVCNMCGVVLYN